MKKLFHYAVVILLLAILDARLPGLFAQGTAFTYQGRLNSASSPAIGTFDLRFALFDATTAGTQQGLLLTNAATVITNGLFTVGLDFGNQFPGAGRWLEIAVRTNGATTFTTLAPRQALTPSPYAVFAGVASNVSGTISSANIAGTYSGAVTLNNIANSFSGNGTGVTNVNAVTLNGVSSSGFWKTNGNVGANPTNGAFLGTSDNLPLELRVNNSRVLRFEPNATSPNVIAGSSANAVSNGMVGATVLGGGIGGSPNRAGGNYATVLGGSGNVASGNNSVAIGTGNTASGNFSTAIGDANNATGAFSTALGEGTTAGSTTATAMGGNTVASGFISTAMGYGSTASGSVATAMGYFNVAAGDYSTVMGYSNSAAGDYSSALGYYAKAAHDGSFVWADSSSRSYFTSTATNQFLIRAGNGVGINKNNPATALDVNGTATAAMFVGNKIGLGTTNPAWSVDALASQAVTRLTTTNNLNGADIELKNTTAGNSTLGALSFNNAAGTYPGQIAYTSDDSMSFRVAGFNSMTLNSSGAYVTGLVLADTLVSGSLGIGTTTPGFDIDVVDSQAVTRLTTSGSANGSGIELKNTTAGSTVLGAINFNNAASTYPGQIAYSSGDVMSFRIAGLTRMTISGAGAAVSSSVANASALVGNSQNGSFAIGVEGDTTGGIGVKGYASAAGGWAVWGVATNSGALAGYFQGDVKVDGTTTTKVLTITGGADVAEPFNLGTGSGEIPAGAVVVIDAQNPGQLKLSDRPYDTRVAGVISGANGISPGIQMHQQGMIEGGKNVALTGRVYVQADTSNGAIQPGDMLTTSAVPGHAMKVSDHAKAAGAILGKAMTALTEGKGMVLVLVTLQ